MNTYKLITVTTAAQLLGVSPTSVRLLIKAGRLRAVRLGHHLRIPMDALDAFVSGCADG